MKNGVVESCEGWKVITTDRKSLNGMLEYPVNVEVFPKIKDSKIFFFKDDRHARSFSMSLNSYHSRNYIYNYIYCIVVRCTATNPKICNRSISSRFLDPISIKKYWSKSYIKSVLIDMCKGETYKMLHLPPDGTWLADSITCFDKELK
jgi:hypothetical protein